MVLPIQLCRYFTEAALDVYNCHHVVLTSVTVEHNRGSGISGISYRGNTGGISFGYNNLPLHFSTPSVYVSDSIFSNNTAAADSVFLTSSQAFARRVFTGRGGALAVFCNESLASLNVTIIDSVFEHNSARSFGGGVYILPGGGAATHHNVLLQRCSFDSNEAGICGGGVQVTYPTTGPKHNPHLVTVIDCNVTNNAASFNGGGIYISSITHGLLAQQVQPNLLHIVSYCFQVMGTVLISEVLSSLVTVLHMVVHLCSNHLLSSLTSHLYLIIMSVTGQLKAIIFCLLNVLATSENLLNMPTMVIMHFLVYIHVFHWRFILSTVIIIMTSCCCFFNLRLFLFDAHVGY